MLRVFHRVEIISELIRTLRPDLSKTIYYTDINNQTVFVDNDGVTKLNWTVNCGSDNQFLGIIRVIVDRVSN